MNQACSREGPSQARAGRPYEVTLIPDFRDEPAISSRGEARDDRDPAKRFLQPPHISC